MLKFDRISLIILILMFGNIKYGKAQLISQDPLYKVVFQDEFDSVALNTNKWKTHWRQGYNWTNSNLFTTNCGTNWDVAFNAAPTSAHNWAYDTVGTGKVSIISQKESPLYNGPMIKYVTPCANCDAGWPCDNSTSFCGSDSTVGYKFTSGMLKSTYTFTYGYFEIRYKLPNLTPHTYNSYGPEFWLYNTDGTASDSASSSELDIFEERGTDWKMAPNLHYRNQATSHWWDAVGNPVSQYQPYPVHMFPDGSGQYNGGTWHTVGCEWTPDYTDFYYDSNDTIRRYSDTKFPVHGLYNMPIYVDIGILPMNYCIHDSLQTNWPFTYDIDYVKVYQVKQNCVSRSYLNTSSSTYQDTLFQDLTIGGSGGSAIFSSGTHHLAGQNFILLQEGFEASGTGTVMVSTMKCQSRQNATYSPNDVIPSDPTGLINDMSRSKQNSNDPK